MSRCYSFGLLAVTLVLSILDTPVQSFTLSRPGDTKHDLHGQEAITLEVKNDLSRPNDIQRTKDDRSLSTSVVSVDDVKLITLGELTTEYSTNSEFVPNSEEYEKVKDSERLDNRGKFVDVSYNLTSSETNQIPTWKQYTTINRKTSIELHDEGNSTGSKLKDENDKTEAMLTDETGVPRQDSKSEDVSSLNQIKNFLFPPSIFRTDTQNDLTTIVATTESLLNYNPHSTSEPVTNYKATVESKRGGFLDFSLKSLFEDNNDKNENSKENNTLKPKGRKLSWRFGSRYRSKEDSSAEKSKERTRFRFRNNKDRKIDNNDARESKEAYSKEIDSKEVIITESNLQPKSKGNTNGNRDNEEKNKKGYNKNTTDNYKYNEDIKANPRESNDERKQNEIRKEKEILYKWNQYDKNEKRTDANFKESKNENNHTIDESKSTESSTQANIKSTTDIDIWKKDHVEEKKSKDDIGNDRSKENNNLKHKNRESKERELKTIKDKQSWNQYVNNGNKKTFENISREKIHERRNNEDKKRYSKENISTSSQHNTRTNKKSDTQPSTNDNQPNDKAFEYNTNKELIFYEDKTTTELNLETVTLTLNEETIPTTENVQDTRKSVTIENAKPLSTIDEEGENEPQNPLAEVESTTLTSTEPSKIVAVKFPPNFNLNEVETTSGTYEPFHIPNLLISLPTPRNKAGLKSQYQQNDTTREDEISNKEEMPDISKGTRGPVDEMPNLAFVKTAPIVQMDEYTREEELLKEEILNNNERYKEEPKTTTPALIPVKIYEVSQKTEAKDNIPVDEKLSVKPLSFLNKLKTTILYPVSPNYKPLKKIDVQPPKLFVRDPDDNSWRNESLSSMGIVFNPKASSKSFTQVLKNKTESEFTQMADKQNKTETPDLRERLEKIAELRKSKKKKTEGHGNVLYDYEESSSKEIKDPEPFTQRPTTTTTTTVFPTTSFTTLAPTTTTEPFIKSNDSISDTNATTVKPHKKVFSASEYYDTLDDDDDDDEEEYLTLARIDLKKFTVPVKSDAFVTPPTWLVTDTRPSSRNHDKTPTLQYFPPLTTNQAAYKEYDSDFNHKMGSYTDTESPVNVLPVSYLRPSTLPPDGSNKRFFKNSHDPMQYERGGYVSPPPHADGGDGYTAVTDDGSFNRAADVIKHYRDFLNAVAKDHEEDLNAPFPHTPLTSPPALTPGEAGPRSYDYETDFRTDVLQRFVHSFNQNSERLKSNLPLLYNSSVIHGSADAGGDVASSRAYLSRMLTRPDCDRNATQELSPAYELHYYVPEEEEKQEMEPRPVSPPAPYLGQNQ